MSLPFIHRQPTKQETELLRLAFSTFCDGSGQEREVGGGTRPGWRDFERCVAEVLNGKASESKELFDVVIQDNENKKTYYGMSIKSKQLSRKMAIGDLLDDGRVHMEVSNSPAKFWEALVSKGLSEQDFREKRSPKEFGDTILSVVEGWHQSAARKFNELNPDSELNLENSVYLVVSYSTIRNGLARSYQVHSFDLHFPKNIKWKFVSSKCLRGYDPQFPDETLVDWYALSGGQLKYYPLAKQAKFSSTQFELALTPSLTILNKIKTYWPKQWDSLEKLVKNT